MRSEPAKLNHARLFRAGKYAAATLDGTAGEVVKGFAMSAENDDVFGGKIMEADRIEGYSHWNKVGARGYVRVQCEATLYEGRRMVPAYVYRYVGDTTDLTQIPSGDWAQEE